MKFECKQQNFHSLKFMGDGIKISFDTLKVSYAENFYFHRDPF